MIRLAKRRAWGSARDAVLKLFREHPNATSYWLAEQLGLGPEYVRETLKRNRKSLARRQGCSRVESI
jgi:hypothetical protein